jgi:hypothetical protein
VCDLCDLYSYSRLQVEAQDSIPLTHGLRYVVHGLNLNNEVFDFYQGSPQHMIQRGYDQPTVVAGFGRSPTFGK